MILPFTNNCNDIMAEWLTFILMIESGGSHGV